jgi:hypothetical protein
MLVEGCDGRETLMGGVRGRVDGDELCWDWDRDAINNDVGERLV